MNIVCTFTGGIDEMRRKDQRDTLKVLAVLDECRCFSVFEATASLVIGRTITDLFERGMIVEDEPMPYPWTHVRLTLVGYGALIKAGLTPTGGTR